MKTKVMGLFRLDRDIIRRKPFRSFIDDVFFIALGWKGFSNRIANIVMRELAGLPCKHTRVFLLGTTAFVKTPKGIKALGNFVRMFDAKLFATNCLTREAEGN